MARKPRKPAPRGKAKPRRSAVLSARKRGRGRTASRRAKGRATGRARKAARPAARRKTAPGARRTATARRHPRATTRRTAAPKTPAPRRAAPKQAAAKTPAAARAVRTKAVPPRPAPVKAKPTKKIPIGLMRERRTLRDERQPPPVSSPDRDRLSGAVLTGQEELVEKLLEHTETGPVMTGGDLDGDWERAYSSGDEAPGGDNPTPDQGNVEENGKALGIRYDDNEELRLGEKEAERDRHRWEYDPASAEDYRDRDEE